MDKSTAKTLVLIAAFLGLVLLGATVAKMNFQNSWDPTPLERLSIRLEGQYKRSLSKNKYSLNFYSKEPNIIEIRVKYYPDADVQLVYSVIREAERFVQKMAQDDYKIYNLHVNSTLKMVDRGQTSDEITF